jgi:hypothetical protein
LNFAVELSYIFRLKQFCDAEKQIGRFFHLKMLALIEEIKNFGQRRAATRSFDGRLIEDPGFLQGHRLVQVGVDAVKVAFTDE